MELEERAMKIVARLCAKFSVPDSEVAIMTPSFIKEARNLGFDWWSLVDSMSSVFLRNSRWAIWMRASVHSMRYL